MGRSQAIGQPLTRFVFREDQDVYYLQQKRPPGSAGLVEGCELRLQGQDGVLRWVQMQSALVQGSDGVQTCRVTLTDIGERKRAEAAASENARRLAEAQRIGHIGSWRWIPSEDRVEWSDEMFRIFGISPEAFDGSTAASIQAFHPDDRPMLEQATQKALAERKPQVVECRLLRPDGTIRYVRSESEIHLHDD